MTTSDEAGTFCHDHIQHPLMWCDEKRRLVERRNAEESLRMWRRRKAEEMARKEREKQEYYELFVKHCPWGKPGGGAPNTDVRRKDITAVGLHSTAPIATTAHHRLTSLQACRFGDYFTKHKRCLDPVAAYHPHYYHHQHQQQQHHSVPRVTAHTHHAVPHISGDNARPIQASSTLTLCERDVGTVATSSGDGGVAATTIVGAAAGGGIKVDANKRAESLQITLKDHPSMSFRNKGHVDIEVRYKPNAATKGKPMLEKIVVTESDKCPLVLEHTKGKEQANALTNGSKKMLDKIEKTTNKDPWGKPGPGGKPWRSPKAVGSSFMKSLGWTNKQMLKDLDQDNPVTPADKPTFRKSRASRKPTKCCEICTCTCPAMILNSNPLKPIQKQHPNAIKQQKPKICPRLLRHNKTIDTTTDNSANNTRNVGFGGGGCVKKDADNNGVELVPLLARRRAFERPISLSTTDVTKRTASHDRLHTAAADVATTDVRYLHDLNYQIAQKRRSISVTQQLDKDECNQHFIVFDTFWGRPGHGAPPIKTNRRLKLNNLLYGTSNCTSV